MWRVRAHKSFFQKTLELRRGGFWLIRGRARPRSATGGWGCGTGGQQSAAGRGLARDDVARAGREVGGLRSGAARGWLGGSDEGGGRVPGGGDWVGVKGELSLASPPPLGAGWREIAWAGFLGGLATRVGAVRGRQDFRSAGSGRARSAGAEQGGWQALGEGVGRRLAGERRGRSGASKGWVTETAVLLYPMCTRMAIGGRGEARSELRVLSGERRLGTGRGIGRRTGRRGRGWRRGAGVDRGVWELAVARAAGGSAELGVVDDRGQSGDERVVVLAG